MVMTYKECIERFKSPYQIAKAVESGELYKIEKGIYSSAPDAYDLEIVISKYPEAIITMNTAFYFHGLTDSIPDEYSIATLKSSKALKDKRVKQYYIEKNLLNLGVTHMEKFGVRFRIYDKERMLVELLRFKNKLPYDFYKEIVASYRAQIHELDIARIQYYTEIFPKRKMISEALELEVF